MGACPHVVIPYIGGLSYIDDQGHVRVKTDREFKQPGWCHDPEDQSRIKIRCGGCGFVVGFSDQHQVAPDGTVTPSIFHDSAAGGTYCGWHVWGILEGWHGARPRSK